MTKEEILEISDDNHPYDLGMATVTQRAALEAMGGWAKLEAMGFGLFVAEHLKNVVKETIAGVDTPNQTGEELYNLYLQSKTI